MNKSKQKILMYAEVYRAVSNVQNQHLELIADELAKLYPSITDENVAIDWALDIVNEQDNAGAIKTIERIGQIVDAQTDEMDELTRLRIKVKELQDYIEKRLNTDHYHHEPSN